MMRNPKLPFSGGPQGRVGAGLIAIALLAGCASSNPPTTQPLTEDQKQDAILNDPMNYKPQIDRTVTGGNSPGFGKGLNNDLNDVLNP